MEKIKQFAVSEAGKDVLTVIVVILVGLGSFELGRLSKSDGVTTSGVKIEYPDDNQGATALNATDDMPKTVIKPKTTAWTPAPNPVVAPMAPIDAPEVVVTAAVPANKNFFGSKRGSTYFPIACPAGEDLAEENRIYFSTSFEAETDGYELAEACQ